MDGTVELIENLGSELYVHIKVDDKTLVMKMSETIEIEVGAKITIGIDSKDIKIFDKNTEKRINL